MIYPGVPLRDLTWPQKRRRLWDMLAAPTALVIGLALACHHWGLWTTLTAVGAAYAIAMTAFIVIATIWLFVALATGGR